jgi:hypothetical protein
MFDIHHTAARAASDWPAIVGKLPKALTDLIDAFEAVSYVGEPYVAVDAGAITAKNAEQYVRDLTETLGKAAHFDDARSRVLRALAISILHSAEAAVPELIEEIRPEFEKAVSDFTEAVELLPEQVGHDTLVDAGPDVLAAYHRAVAANKVIAKFDAWLAGLVQLPAFAGRTPELVRIVKPTTRAELYTLLDSNGHNYLQLSPLYVIAAREGIEFDLLDPIAASRLREEIEAQPVEHKQIQFLKV